jgi:5'-nucleotidase
MGTMLVAAENNAADLNFMKHLGYDAAAIGNHEFDWGCAKLAQMINAAEKPMVPLLASNLHFSEKPEDDDLEALFGPDGEAGKYIHPYIVRETSGGIKVGMLGLIGMNAKGSAIPQPAYLSESMTELAAEAQEVVNTLREDEKVDVVIALAHMGIEGEPGNYYGESIDLGRMVHGIDVIVSGHEHTPVESGIEIPCERGAWTTYTLEAGYYGKYLGKSHLVRKGGTTTYTGELLPIDDTIVGEEDVNQHVDTLVEDVETNVVGHYPLVPEPGAFLTGDYFQVLAHSDFDIILHKESCNNLGYLVADAIREDSGAQIAVVSNGEVRRSLMRVNGDEFCLPDTFVTMPLGTGDDDIVGSSIVTFYLTLFELELVLDATVCEQGLETADFMLSTSGLRLVCDTGQMPYARLRKLNLYDNIDETDAGTDIFDAQNGGFLIDQTTLLSITTTNQVAARLTLFNLTPKDANGDPVNLEDVVVLDSDQREIKWWYSAMRRLASFPDKVSHMYNDDEAQNPIGPYDRRCEGVLP